MAETGSQLVRVSLHALDLLGRDALPGHGVHHVVGVIYVAEAQHMAELVREHVRRGHRPQTRTAQTSRRESAELGVAAFDHTVVVGHNCDNRTGLSERRRACETPHDACILDNVP